MANIRKETFRHDWREQKIPQLRTGFNDDPNRMKLLCWNCRRPHDVEAQGPPPVDGCITSIKVRNCGDARQRDYFKQEEARRAAEIRAEKLREAHAEAQLREYLKEYHRRHG